MDAMDTTDATEAGGPTLGRRLLGAQLRRLREERGITRRDAAKAIRGSESKMSRLELGRHGVKVTDVQDLLTRYGVLDPAAREEILSLARDANARGWWHGYNDVLPTWFERYLGLESAAERIHTYEGQFIPGLLQTEEYARAVTWVGQSRPHTGGLDDEIDRRVALRATRQQILTQPGGPHLWAVIDEGALRRPIGGRRVMRAQIEHLLGLRDAPNITVQVMPFTFGGHVAQIGAFSLLRFTGHDLTDMVYLEHLTGALYLDKQEDTDRYREAFLRLVTDSQTPTHSADTLASIMTDS